MYFRRFRIWFFALAAFAVLIGATLLVQKRLDSIVKTDKLVDEAGIEGLPPTVAFTTVALGGFRGILADMLWLRTNGLQQQGKYFEMVQLASWITKLQPKFTGATAYLAWNMAYNISVTYTSPVDRWRWVQRGIELIRDEALDYNANDPLLYRELGWIYQHKIGNMLDDAQRYYKYMICKEMMKVYNGDSPDWKALAAAPKTISEFRKLHADDSKLFESVKAAGFENLEALSAAFRKEGVLPEKLAESLAPETKNGLDTFLRALWLREYYKLRPEIVLEINQKYGELDWRLSDSFAIYWATLGIMYDVGDGVPQDIVLAHMWCTLAASGGDDQAAAAQRHEDRFEELRRDVATRGDLSDRDRRRPAPRKLGQCADRVSGFCGDDEQSGARVYSGPRSLR